ncbi:MAG: hypothetical protein S4CHLAM7_14330 [Chlamydiae bacterium]|nr:hypothetical protein [Chlamydiota bacterium]
MTQKTFLLDTNVLLYDPKALSHFKNALLVIPISVIEELDDMKRLPNDLGRNARLVMRSFDLLKAHHGKANAITGIKTENGCVVRIFSCQGQEANGQFILDRSARKNHVLYSAYQAAKEYPDIIFLSKDFATRLKAQMTGIHAEDYKNASFSHRDIYTGLKKATISKKEVDLFLKNGVIDWSDEEIYANEYCVLSSDKDTHIIGRYDKAHKQLVALNPLPHDLWSIKPRNIQQRCALDLILREDIKLVTLVGQAGTGKTLLALACALRKVFDEGYYSKILVSRPIMPLGKDIGFLPGTKEEKLFHWMQPIYDNLEYLCQAGSGNQDTQENLRWIKESQKLELEAVTYIRGRTLPNMFIIIDEAQNLTPHEIKTVVSRAGEGTKVILAGDPTQIDNPYLDVDTNGLTFAISKFGDHPIFGNMTFDVTERSELSSLAAQVL